MHCLRHLDAACILVVSGNGRLERGKLRARNSVKNKAILVVVPARTDFLLSNQRKNPVCAIPTTSTEFSDLPGHESCATGP